MHRIFVLGLSLLAGLVHAAPAEASDARRWIMTVDNGKPAGELVVRCADGGDCQTRYIFKDNGRGPEVTERYRVAADGTLARYEAKGKTTFGSVVDERYEGKGRGGSWRSTTERGGSDDALGKLYLPLNGSGIVYENMLRLTTGGRRW